MSIYNDKGIDYVQNAIKKDKHWDKRDIKSVSELTILVREQYDDNNSTIKRNNESKDVLDQNDTITLDELKEIEDNGETVN